MRRLLFVLAIALTLCSVLVGCDPAFGLNPVGYKHLHKPLDEVWPFVASFEYQWDYDNYWKSPTEFEKDGGGDCEDFATDLIYYLGDESSAILVRFPGWENTHVIVKYRGLYLEPRGVNHYYNRSEFEQILTWSYNEIMHFTTDGGTKNIK